MFPQACGCTFVKEQANSRQGESTRAGNSQTESFRSSMADHRGGGRSGAPGRDRGCHSGRLLASHGTGGRNDGRRSRAAGSCDHAGRPARPCATCRGPRHEVCRRPSHSLTERRARACNFPLRAKTSAPHIRPGPQPARGNSRRGASRVRTSKPSTARPQDFRP